MIKKIEDLLIISDMDNTLLTAKEGIPKYNIEMINKFQELGGKFTVATGRTATAVSKYLDEINLNTPAITYNGAVLWDFEKNTYLRKVVLPEGVEDVVKAILKEFPTIGCEIMGENFRIYTISENIYTYEHLVHEQLSYVCSNIDNIKGRWIKVLFACDNETLLLVQEYCKNLERNDIEFIMTNSIYFEIMPKGVSKAVGLEILCKNIGIDINNTIAIGDYYNDVEILKRAGLSVCVDNAPDDIKEICKVIVPSCTDGGVGHLISQIINSYN